MRLDLLQKGKHVLVQKQECGATGTMVEIVGAIIEVDQNRVWVRNDSSNISFHKSSIVEVREEKERDRIWVYLT